jgi:RNA polymerase sigma factor (sigma-70 family)
MAVTALSDAELLLAARNGDEAAFTELYVRHHAAARRLAASYRRGGDVDDLVNGAFERVLGALRRGGGPRESFRAYLFVTLRRLAMEETRRSGGTTDTLDDVPEPVFAVAGGPDLEGAEREMVTEAFESLPGRWQAVLWHTAVEGRQPREIAGVVGLSANAAAALAYRARERLRQAYLQAHLQTSPRPLCEPHRSRLGGYVREGLSRRDHKATAEHLEQCESCQDLVSELTDVNKMLVRSVAPLFLAGGAAASKIAGLTAAGSQAASAASAASVAGGPAGAATVVGGAWGSVRRAATTGGGAAAAAAAAVALAITTIPHDDGPSSEPEQNWLAGPPAGEGEQTTTLDEQPASATPPTTAAGSSTSGSTTPTTSAPATAAPSTDPPLVEGDVGLDVGLGDGLDVEVDAEVQVDLDLQWTNRLLGNGTLAILVPNRGSEPLEGLEVEVDLSGDATALLASTCRATSDGLLDAVLGLVTQLTCGLSTLAPGATATTRLEVQVAAAQQAANVTVRLHGQVVAHAVEPIG